MVLSVSSLLLASLAVANVAAGTVPLPEARYKSPTERAKDTLRDVKSGGPQLTFDNKNLTSSDLAYVADGLAYAPEPVCTALGNCRAQRYPDTSMTIEKTYMPLKPTALGTNVRVGGGSLASLGHVSTGTQEDIFTSPEGTTNVYGGVTDVIEGTSYHEGFYDLKMGANADVKGELVVRGKKNFANAIAHKTTQLYGKVEAYNSFTASEDADVTIGKGATLNVLGRTEKYAYWEASFGIDGWECTDHSPKYTDESLEGISAEECMKRCDNFNPMQSGFGTQPDNVAVVCSGINMNRVSNRCELIVGPCTPERISPDVVYGHYHDRVRHITTSSNQMWSRNFVNGDFEAQYDINPDQERATRVEGWRLGGNRAFLKPYKSGRTVPSNNHYLMLGFGGWAESTAFPVYNHNQAQEIQFYMQGSGKLLLYINGKFQQHYDCPNPWSRFTYVIPDEFSGHAITVRFAVSDSGAENSWVDIDRVQIDAAFFELRGVYTSAQVTDLVYDDRKLCLGACAHSKKCTGCQTSRDDVWYQVNEFAKGDWQAGTDGQAWFYHKIYRGDKYTFVPGVAGVSQLAANGGHQTIAANGAAISGTAQAANEEVCNNNHICAGFSDVGSVGIWVSTAFATGASAEFKFEPKAGGGDSTGFYIKNWGSIPIDIARSSATKNKATRGTARDPAIACWELKRLGVAVQTGTVGGKFFVHANSGRPFEVFCDLTSHGGGWTMVDNDAQNSVQRKHRMQGANSDPNISRNTYLPRYPWSERPTLMGRSSSYATNPTILLKPSTALAREYPTQTTQKTMAQYQWHERDRNGNPILHRASDFSQYGSWTYDDKADRVGTLWIGHGGGSMLSCGYTGGNSGVGTHASNAGNTCSSWVR